MNQLLQLPNLPPLVDPNEPPPPSIESYGPPPKVTLRAIKTLGLDKKTWDKRKMQAMQEFGRYLNVPVTARVLQTVTFGLLESLRSASEYAQNILEDPTDKITPDQRMMAGQLACLVAKSFKEIAGQAMELAEKGEEKREAKRRRNAPPLPGGTINVEGSTVQIVQGPAAKNGNEAEPIPVQASQ